MVNAESHGLIPRPATEPARIPQPAPSEPKRTTPPAEPNRTAPPVKPEQPENPGWVPPSHPDLPPIKPEFDPDLPQQPGPPLMDPENPR
jgi:hypothetical protein